ncbi:hypothetical protein F751_6256 [Auxenochlorella protothecoides]|uniref:Uncharacterized protein n=1 Tax=Auxenochlorella protothecoides TaxID=3075 RepID=A0A087SK51_AUXPR|nr:hypothetical protein F751_6256 [Auxenochlorella protothecoides]KFM26105.1 hypothetical protein F751_6256 [Auxenochlorella protothecoides]
MMWCDVARFGGEGWSARRRSGMDGAFRQSGWRGVPSLERHNSLQCPRLLPYSAAFQCCSATEIVQCFLSARPCNSHCHATWPKIYSEQHQVAHVVMNPQSHGTIPHYSHPQSSMRMRGASLAGSSRTCDAVRDWAPAPSPAAGF